MFSLSLPSPASLLTLGKAYGKILLRKLFNDQSQLPTFLEHYTRDGIVLFEPEDAEVLQAASRCYGCGECNVQAVMDEQFAALGPAGPMAFVLGVSRHSGHHDTARFDGDLSDETLAKLTRACPVKVPFVPLVALVRRRAKTLTEAREEGQELATRPAA